MNETGIGAQYLGVLVNVTPETAKAAAVTVAVHAVDEQERETFLQMLGLSA